MKNGFKFSWELEQDTRFYSKAVQIRDGAPCIIPRFQKLGYCRKKLWYNEDLKEKMKLHLVQGEF